MRKLFLVLTVLAVTACAVYAASWDFNISYFNGGEKPSEQKVNITSGNNLWHLMCEERFSDNETYRYPCETGYMYRNIDNETVFIVGEDEIVCKDITDNVKSCYVKNMNIGIVAVEKK